MMWYDTSMKYKRGAKDLCPSSDCAQQASATELLVADIGGVLKTVLHCHIGVA